MEKPTPDIRAVDYFIIILLIMNLSILIKQFIPICSC